jgi:hypothetical protein
MKMFWNCGFLYYLCINKNVKIMKTLKFILLTLLITLSTSCKKEDIQPCNCGVVVDKSTFWGGTEDVYFFDVKNNCTGNVESVNICRISSYSDSDIPLGDEEIHYNSINIGDNECVYIFHPDGSKSEYFW